MSKRILGLCLTLMLAVALFAGCSGQTAESPSAAEPSADQSAEAPSEEAAVVDNDAENTEGTTDSDKTYNVVFIAQSMSNESQTFASKMFEKHAAEYGLNVTIMDAKSDPALEAQLVTTCIAQEADAIFVNANDPKGIIPSLMAAKDAGVVVCMFSADLAEEDQQYRDVFVGANDVESGKSAGEAIIEHFPEGANIVEIGGQSGHDSQIKRHDGFAEALEGSNINIIDSQNCSAWATNDCLDIMQDFIVKYGEDIDGVFVHWDNGATGAIQALENAGMDMPYIVAVDGCKAGFDQVKAGTQAVSLMQNFETMAMTSLDLCRKVLDGETVEPVNYISWDTVTKDNIDTFTYPEW